MATNGNEKPNWFTVFRTDKNNVVWLHKELTEGRLRQGWGAPGFSLKTADDRRIGKTQWEETYRAHWGEYPSTMRFAILTRMLDMKYGDVVVVPKMPEWEQFTIARVSGGYRFEIDGDRKDFRHIVPVYRNSVRSFSYRANDDGVSRLRHLLTEQITAQRSLFVTRPSRSRRLTGYCKAQAT